ncbi:DNA-binding protein HGH1 [Blumeria hordei DH14]|uniref:DNA-binding protein HGH1 n=1 Tax=Blumeria graminis f. sp. hordei (strain DH14) TaxID=546991 RepID=N1JI19_BLUG1|nr:DNA-binding protein HGH1 [Blumeria hordei DH14]
MSNMPSELEEIELTILAVENLVPFSLSQPAVFKTKQLLPVKDLMLLVRDYKPIAHNALTILINLSSDSEKPTEPNVDDISILLANLGKVEKIKTLLSMELVAPSDLKSDGKVINQLLDVFVKGADGTYNTSANYDYLSYLFSDLAKHPEGRDHLLARQEYDGVIPLCKLAVFTSHHSHIRRQGVASTIKNVCFETSQHTRMILNDDDGIGILPYLLLPLMGGEEYDVDEIEGMLEECQLLPSDKKREVDVQIIATHIESLILLTVSRECRDYLREISVYPIIRELHLAVADDTVRDNCERLVQLLMRDEESKSSNNSIQALSRKPVISDKKDISSSSKSSAIANSWIQQLEQDDDDEIVEV